MIGKKELHELVERLPDGTLDTAMKVLTHLVEGGTDQVLGALEKAPLDDEPLTKDELADLKEADSDITWKKFISHEDVKRSVLGDSWPGR